MLVWKRLRRFRRAVFVQGKSIKLICRELRVSRKVRAEGDPIGGEEFRYEREGATASKIGPGLINSMNCCGERREGGTRAPDPDPTIRGTAGPRLWRGLRSVRRYAGRWPRSAGTRRLRPTSRLASRPVKPISSTGARDRAC